MHTGWDANIYLFRVNGNVLSISRFSVIGLVIGHM
jgi:hypothetical protein